MEKLMMQVALIDQVTKPLANINAAVGSVGGKACSRDWGRMAGGAGAMISGVLGIPSDLTASD